MARGGGSRLVTLIALGFSIVLVLLLLSTRMRRRARSRPVPLLATYRSLFLPTESDVSVYGAIIWLFPKARAL